MRYIVFYLDPTITKTRFYVTSPKSDIFTTFVDRAYIFNSSLEAMKCEINLVKEREELRGYVFIDCFCG